MSEVRSTGAGAKGSHPSSYEQHCTDAASLSSARGSHSSSYLQDLFTGVTLPQAIDLVLGNAMPAAVLFAQLPPPMIEGLNRFSEATHGRKFLDLPQPEQAVVLQALRDELNGTCRQMTMLEALRRASRGMMPPASVFEQLPPELKNWLDQAARRKNGMAFSSVMLAQRKAILKDLADELERAPQPQKLTLAQALRAVALGEMEPDTLFGQLPPDLQGMVDETSRQRWHQDYRALAAAQKRAVFEDLSSLAQQAQRPSP